MTDVAWSGYFDDYGDMWGIRELMAIGDEDDARDWCDKRFGADGRGLPKEVTVLSAPDNAFVSSETNGRAFRRAMAEALRQGTAGYAQDIVIEGRPWAFDTTRITMPVRVIHGADDTLLTVGHSKHTADLIRDASFEVVPGHGHLSIFGEFQGYAATLADHVP